MKKLVDKKIDAEDFDQEIFHLSAAISVLDIAGRANLIRKEGLRPLNMKQTGGSVSKEEK